MRRTFLDLHIGQREDGEWDLKQEAGPCDDTSEHWIILAPEQLETLARMAGFVPAADVASACERMRDRLRLLVAMVEAHTRQGDPLRTAAACLLTGHATNLVADPSNQNGCTNQNGCSPSPSPASAPLTDGYQIPLMEGFQ